MEELLTVGELAKKMSVTVRTLQYYDKKGVLKPSAKSPGGRRLYTKKDMVKLHQILSLKFLGFSLEEIKTKLLNMDTPEEVAEMLKKQKEIVKKQIDSLTAALTAIDSLEKEVVQMKEVHFDKYADIVALLRQGNEEYWVIKLFDTKLLTHIRDKFGAQPEKGLRLYEAYTTLLDEALLLKELNEPPTSEKSLELAKKWWEMVVEFTGGDMSLLPELEKFNEDKQGWDGETARKQAEADDFLKQVLAAYFQQEGFFSGMEG